MTERDLQLKRIKEAIKLSCSKDRESSVLGVDILFSIKGIERFLIGIHSLIDSSLTSNRPFGYLRKRRGGLGFNSQSYHDFISIRHNPREKFNFTYIIDSLICGEEKYDDIIFSEEFSCLINCLFKTNDKYKINLERIK